MRLFFVVLITVVLSFSLCSCFTTAKVAPTKVVVVKKLPKSHKVVFIKGQRYYAWNGKNYRKTNKGYVVVRF
ncbi:DUF6515 family protein [uncultured Lutibacter sp.]|uniref:DUF6515 family protein n=1 Tax=uncultured Lutibacter sp. TaxID=437739 RepID=UPI002604DE1A|nr:DUF6515 family protein [uncultured Lutibacter sp.]